MAMSLDVYGQVLVVDGELALAARVAVRPIGLLAPSSFSL